jgi:hypothetical protein
MRPTSILASIERKFGPESRSLLACGKRGQLVRFKFIRGILAIGLLLAYGVAWADEPIHLSPDNSSDWLT